MVTYGPWQEGRTHVEILRGAESDTYTVPPFELLGEEPTRRSGWSIASNNGYKGVGVIQWEHVGGLDDPPPPDGDKSLSAWDLAMRAGVVAGSGLQWEARSTGGAIKTGPTSPWEASHGWELSGTEYRMGYARINDINEYYSVPSGFDPNTNDYYTELEPFVLGFPARIELLSVEVMEPGALGYFMLYSKDAGATTGFLNAGSASIVASKINPAPFVFDVGAMQALQESIDSTGSFPGWYGSSADYPGMPRLAWLYNGPPLMDPHFDGARLVTETDSMPVKVRITYKFPRWRQVFYEDPYRRTYPRDDALAGGAGRTWPPARSVQSSNRTFGGYL